MLLPETPLSAGMKVGEMLRRSVESKEVVNKTSNENLGRITLSIGVAQYLPGESISRVIERADEALYKSKKTGRNRVSAAEHPENIMATLRAAPAVALKDSTIKE